jgi:hypothetical protein
VVCSWSEGLVGMKGKRQAELGPSGVDGFGCLGRQDPGKRKALSTELLVLRSRPVVDWECG